MKLPLNPKYTLTRSSFKTVNTSAQHSRRFSTRSFSKVLVKNLPKSSTRYLRATGVMGFLVVLVASIDWLTTYQLIHSPYFRYSFKLVQHDPEVKQLLGENIQAPWRVSVKKHKRRFQLTYTLKGQKGNWATVVAASTIDPKRGQIDESSFRYIVVQPTSLRQICFGVVTDGLYDLAATIGAEAWFKESEQAKQHRLENEILVVDRVE